MEAATSTTPIDLANAPVMASDKPMFRREKHISYWLRCLRSPLPTQYTSNDSNRMTLAFFTVCALDLLGVLHDRVSLEERKSAVDWIYSCQRPEGGFRASPATDFGQLRNEENAAWDPFHVPATYFALGALATLGDDLGRVKRRECLRWLKQCQRADGSFGETVATLDEGAEIHGGSDLRFAYCAMCIRWILRGNKKGDVHSVPDVDVDKLVRCIRESQTYDGGIADLPFHEAHAGFTYLAVGILSLTGRISRGGLVHEPEAHDDDDPPRRRQRTEELDGPDLTIQWLVSRLTTYIDDEEYEPDEDDDQQPVGAAQGSGETGKGFFKAGPSTTPAEPVFDPPDAPWTGFSGRVNKIADTCYAFWVGAALSLINPHGLTPQAEDPVLIDPLPVQRWLLEKTQHGMAGGFGKLPGDPPDIYHSYLGLATLSMLEHGLRREGEHHDFGALDPALSVSSRAREWVEGLNWRKKLLDRGER